MTLYVPERKVSTRQPPKTQGRLNPSNISDGLIFLSNGGSYVNRVTDTLGVRNNNATTVDKEYSAYKTVTGTADRVDFTNTLTKTGQTEYSFACLFKWNGGGANTNQYLINRHADGTNFVILNLPNAGSRANVSWSAATASAPVSYASGVYHLLTASTPVAGSSTASTAKLFFNGVALTIDSSVDGATYSASGKTVILGGRSSDNLRNFDGEIALAAIWDRVLTNAEHRAIAQNPWQLFAPRRQWFAFQPLNKLYVPERKVWTRQPSSAKELAPVAGASPVLVGVPGSFYYGAVPTRYGTLLPEYTTSGQGIKFDSANADAIARRLEFPDIDITGAMTVVSVINLRTPPTRANKGVVAKYIGYDGGAPVNQRAWLQMIDYQSHASNIYPRFGVSGTGSSAVVTAASGTSLSNGYHVLVGVYKPSEFIRQYVDGALYNENTTSIPASIYNSTAPIWVGTQYTATDAAGPSTYCLAGTVLLYGVYSGAIDHNTALSLSSNPWQLFAPRRQWFALSQVANVQLLYPSSDISTGSWTPSTGTTLYGTIDETPYSDSDYIETSTTTSCEIKFSAGASPSSRNNHIIRYRLLPGTGVLTMTLKCGSTTITSWDHILTASTQSIENTLTVGEATSITDYSDLRIVATVS